MKVRTAILALGLAVSVSSSAFAEFYVLNPEPDMFVSPPHYYKHRRAHHYARRHYYDLWTLRHKHCYDPDMSTGDDDPCYYPNMDIDE